uniref:VPS10 domain-containing protein n=1 Tax=Tetradesmus obliquus TaxID=3088 RepID=A0A383W6M8_TETOB
MAAVITGLHAALQTYLESKVVGVEWAGTDDQHVFVITANSAVWRSKDGGSTFEDVTEHFKSSIKGEEKVSISQILSHKTSPNLMLFMNNGEYMWTSNDYGETLNPHKNPGGFRGLGTTLKPHPTRPDWVLAHAKRPGCKLLDEVEMRCAADLLVSQNAFTDHTWTNLTANAAGKIAGFVDWGWGVSACNKTCCMGLGMVDETVFATMYEHAGDWDTAWDPDVHFVRSDDWFKTIKKKVPCGNQFELLGRQVYLAVSNKCPQDMAGKPRKFDPTGPPGITLHTSDDAGMNFKAACLPVALRQQGYELLETHDNAGAIVIVDYMVKMPMGNLQASSAYSAGPHHALFSQSLSSIYKQDVLSGSTDFLRVDGIPGVFIANQLSTMMDGGGGMGGMGGMGMKRTVVTRITFNGGGSWQAIKAPSTFNYQKCNRCGGATNCSLHLHGSSSWFFGSIQFPSAYSNPSAPGLLVGSGNVAGEGSGLDDNDGVLVRSSNVAGEGSGLDDNDGLCTWLSFDGGFSWSDIAEGTWIYEYADWGGLVVMSKHELSGPATEVRFSYDYGRCWRTVPLQTALYVENIRIEPDGQRPKVLLHGKACRKTSDPKCSYEASDTRSGIQGIVYALDIGQVMGDKMPLCKESDYEQWTVPADDHTPRCLLGEQRMFTRRKQDAVCLQGGDYKRPPPTNKTCGCTAADVECDYGYVMSGGTCMALPQEKLTSCPSIDEGHYHVSSTGKRLVHGDNCTGLDSLIADTDGKGQMRPGAKPGVQPHGGSSSSSGGSSGGGGRRSSAHGVFVFFVLLLVLGGVFGVWYQFLASAVAKAQVEDLAVSAKAFGVSFVGLVVDKASECFGRGRAGGFGGFSGRPGGGGGGMPSYQPLDEELNFFQPLPAAGEAEAGLMPQSAFSPSGRPPSGSGDGVFTIR